MQYTFKTHSEKEFIRKKEEVISRGHTIVREGSTKRADSDDYLTRYWAVVRMEDKPTNGKKINF